MTPPPSFSLSSVSTLAAWDWNTFGLGLGVVGFAAVCVLLVLAILIQKPQGGGLSGAFGAGSSGSGQTAFGTKT
ncbi:MAG: preprotein translocase subunit SecG, partial [Phycisphaerales bacterium]|nr:preprotein translocase subunit SecG [Phycisphaerales bacterium]